MHKEAGQSLAELLVAILISMLMASAVMSLVLTSGRGGGQADRQLAADLAVKRLQALLKNFNTAADAAVQTLIPGPNAGNAVNSWSINGWPSPSSYSGAAYCGCGVSPTCSNGGAVVDSSGNSDALAAGPHQLTNFLPWWLEKCYAGKISYNVNGGSVTFSVNWTEPQ